MIYVRVGPRAGFSVDELIWSVRLMKKGVRSVEG